MFAGQRKGSHYGAALLDPVEPTGKAAVVKLWTSTGHPSGASFWEDTVENSFLTYSQALQDRKASGYTIDEGRAAVSLMDLLLDDEFNWLIYDTNIPGKNPKFIAHKRLCDWLRLHELRGEAPDNEALEALAYCRRENAGEEVPRVKLLAGRLEKANVGAIMPSPIIGMPPSAPTVSMGIKASIAPAASAAAMDDWGAFG